MSRYYASWGWYQYIFVETIQSKLETWTSLDPRSSFPTRNILYESGHHNVYIDSTSGEHEYLHQISWQTIDSLLGCFLLHLSVGPSNRLTLPILEPVEWIHKTQTCLIASFSNKSTIITVIKISWRMNDCTWTSSPAGVNRFASDWFASCLLKIHELLCAESETCKWVLLTAHPSEHKVVH